METIENIAADQNYCEMTKMFSNDELKRYTPGLLSCLRLPNLCSIVLISTLNNFFSIRGFELRKEVFLFCDSWTMHQAFTGQSYEYSSSPEGAASTASKTIVSERKRRKKLNDKLLELRGAVPKISKVYASLIKTCH
jgi:hypothetical protein